MVLKVYIPILAKMYIYISTAKKEPFQYNNLPVAKCNLEQVRQSSFKYAAPRLWNDLLLFIKLSRSVEIY